MMMCMAEPFLFYFFFYFFFFLKKQGFLSLFENLVINFSRIPSIMKLCIIAIFLQKSYIWEKPGSLDIGQNALGQSDRRIFKSNKSLDQNYEMFFCMLIQIRVNSELLKNIEVGFIKNGCGNSGHRTLKSNFLKKLCLKNESME